MVVVKNDCGFLGHGTLKFAASQEWIDKISWFFAYWYRFKKAKSCFHKYWVGTVENERDLGILKSGVSHKLSDELSRSIVWSLLADSDGIIFRLTANLLCIFDIQILGVQCICTC